MSDKITTINPATDEPLAEYDPMDQEQVDRMVARAKRSFPEWDEYSLKPKTLAFPFYLIESNLISDFEISVRNF